MPMMWLNAHSEALGELQAEESFRQAEAISVGEGKLKKSDHDKVTRRWRAAIGSDKALAISKKADVSRLLALGIKVRDETR